jgi:hypothetical protein
MGLWQHNTHAQVMTRLTELLGMVCIIKVKDLGEVRGVIEEIAVPAIAEDFQRSIDLTQFRMRLQSGDVVTVPGSAFLKIEHTSVERDQ